MRPVRFSRYLECKDCGKVEYCDSSRIVDRLGELGILRRHDEPDEEVLHELLTDATVGKMACKDCGAKRLVASVKDPFDEQAWGDARKCESCGESIPTERVEIFPNTKLCIKCQAGEERGDAQETPDYCPRCGNIMQLRRRSGDGLAGYTMSCPSCRR